ncbi:MAG: DNA-3-methyladenine glycosylase 2 family protein [Bacteroidota bacterium]
METYKEIIQFYKKDPVLYNAIVQLDDKIKPEPSVDVYKSLLASIVSQQLNTKVADIIWQRFTDLFINRYPHANILLEMPHEEVRKVGLSNSKVNYVKNVAEFSLNNNISFEYLQQRTDVEIIDYLTQIKGVGKWTVQMILMFPMDRPNVFPVDDLGIQRAIKNLYNVTLEKKELKHKLIKISDNWHPYKTLACKYLWKMID